MIETKAVSKSEFHHLGWNFLETSYAIRVFPPLLSSYLILLFNSQIEEFQARPYQQAIIDVCIKRNSIVFLPTGAGKSYIAIQVIRHFSKDIER